MVVQHNLQAMNANRMLNLTHTSLAKATEKLSSGYRINRAADDAAGLAISEKMRKQINGLNQASSNAQAGISCVQTTEGALAEVEDMLQRMNQLSVQAANGINSESDRQDVQDEVDQLIIEINRISNESKFNETHLLKGATDGSTETINKFSAVSYKNATKVDGLGILDKDGNVVTGQLTEGTNYYTEDVNAKLCSALAKDDVVSGNLYDENGTIIYKDGDKVKAADDGKQYYIEDITQYKLDTSKNIQLYDKEGNAVSANAYGRYCDNAGTIKTGELFADKEHTIDATNDMIKVSQDKYASDLSIVYHVGSEGSADNKIEIKVGALNATYLGVDVLSSKENGIKDESGQLATDAIGIISDALVKVSKQRSVLGAVQNRLEHTIKNLDNVAENTTSAEAGIRDTDMATEMVKYSNINILAQAGQSILAQANQANQGVLSLLG